MEKAQEEALPGGLGIWEEPDPDTTFLNQQFSPQFANEQIRNFRDILKKDFNLSQVCGDIAGVMPHQQRSVLVQYLFGIAKADGHVSESEVKVIQQIAAYLRISSQEFEQNIAAKIKDLKRMLQMLK